MSAPMFRPNLAAAADLDALRFPLLASRKLDGIRAIVIGGVLLSRSGKPIPNKAVQAKFGHLEHYDGELIAGPANAPDVFNASTRAVMTIEGSAADVQFHVFDHIEHPADTYWERQERLQPWADVAIVSQELMLDRADLDEFEHQALADGYEGVMTRDPEAPYKNGRSTAREQGLLKVKRFIDFECVVVCANELMRNENELGVSELGYAKRSHEKAGMIPASTLGSLTLRRADGVEFDVGTGFTSADRDRLWAQRDALPGMLAAVKSFPVGEKDKPRMPVFKGLRSRIDQ